MRLSTRLTVSTLGAVARRTAPLLAVVLLASACVTGDATAVANIPSNPAVETFAPSTGVVIANMTRVNNNLFIQDTPIGTGKAAAAGDSVFLRYTGRLINGNVFDTNVNNGKPTINFVLGSGFVIPGWDQGLLGLRVGGRRKLVIGSALAYQNQSPDPRTIPNNATLVFDVELINAK